MREEVMSDKVIPSTNGTTPRPISISSPSGGENKMVPFLALISMISIVIFIPLLTKTEALPSQPVTIPNPTQSPSFKSPYEKQYTIGVKECKDKKEANQIISLLHQEDLPALERKLSNGNRLISSGKFFKKKDADERLALLKSKGFSDSVVLEPKQ